MITEGQFALPLDPAAFAFPRIPPRQQLLKWVGNKQRFAAAIANEFPGSYRRYYEPFVGTGAVLAAMSPHEAVASDVLEPLIQFWHLVQTDPEALGDHYARSWADLTERGREAYDEFLKSFNDAPNPYDLFVLSRACYGGVVRFTRKMKMSTPMGPHRPVPPASVRARLAMWNARVGGTTFVVRDFRETMAQAGARDVVYCDPPYVHSQSILYGAQSFRVADLWSAVESAKARGAFVAVSMDGYRQSGARQFNLDLPEGLFARELLIDRGGCMLRRFQVPGGDMAKEQVSDRLLLTD